MRDDLVSNYNFPHIKTVVINNPIDIDWLRRRKFLGRVWNYPNFPKRRLILKV